MIVVSAHDSNKEHALRALFAVNFCIVKLSPDVLHHPTLVNYSHESSCIRNFEENNIMDNHQTI